MRSQAHVLLAIGCVVSCSPSAEPPGSHSRLVPVATQNERFGVVDPHHYAMRVSANTVALISGPDSSRKIEEGALLAPGNTEPYTKLEVPISLLDAAYEEPDGTLTLSLEEVRQDVLLEFHGPSRTATQPGGSGEARALTFRPGDPWITGYYQIHIEKISRRAVGLFNVVRFRGRPSPYNTIGADYFETGTLPDDRLPALRFQGTNTSLWPELPPSWQGHENP